MLISNQLVPADFIFEALVEGVDIGWITGTKPTYVDDPYIYTPDNEKLATTQLIVKLHAAGILLAPFFPNNCLFKELFFTTI